MKYNKLNYDIPEEVKNEIMRGFKKPTHHKSNNTFKILIKAYDSYTDVVEEIIDNLNTITYYKDYFRLLTISKHEQLNNYVWNLIEKRTIEEFNNFNKKKSKPSMLAKWLPSENSHYDKKLDFVNKIVKILYPNLNNLSAKKRYRKQLSEMRQQLDIVETKLCAKEYDKIDVYKLSNHALIKYNNILCNNPKTKADLIEYYTNICKNAGYVELVCRALSYYRKGLHLKKSFIEGQIICTSWNKLIEDLHLTPDKDMVVNVSPNVINKYYKQFVLTVLLFIEKNGYYIVNGKYPSLIKFDKTATLFDKITGILTNVGSSNKVNEDKIRMLTDKELIIVKDISDPIDCSKYDTLDVNFEIETKSIIIADIVNTHNDLNPSWIQKYTPHLGMVMYFLFLIYIICYRQSW